MDALIGDRPGGHPCPHGRVLFPGRFCGPWRGIGTVDGSRRKRPPCCRRDPLLIDKGMWAVGLRSFFTRHRTPTTVPAPAQVPGAVKGQERTPLSPEELAELDAARKEFLHTAEQAGVKSVHGCSRDGRRWEDDPQTVRAMAAIIRNLHLDKDTPEDQDTTEDQGTTR
ncbi:hypothetical protein NicSoilE8_41540 (plasmid) [Arthrobacter sp. NicSoilE8]|nr:hypothetical protein NicSoilE8_41540 [Arthrobacter sp. NicSoilE8]